MGKIYRYNVPKAIHGKRKEGDSDMRQEEGNTCGKGFFIQHREGAGDAPIHPLLVHCVHEHRTSSCLYHHLRSKRCVS